MNRFFLKDLARCPAFINKKKSLQWRRGRQLPPRSAGWSWRLELECCERKILLCWLELELMAGVV